MTGRWLDPAVVIPRTGAAAAVSRRVLRSVPTPRPTLPRMSGPCWADLAEMALGEPVAGVPEMRDVVLASPAAVWRRGRLRTIANPALPLEVRQRAAADSNLFWQLRLALSEPAVTDDVVAGWISSTHSSASLSQVHDLLEQRPALLETVLGAAPRVSFAAAASLQLTPGHAERLLAGAAMTTSAGRVTVAELAVNPVLPDDARAAAFTRLTRHWRSPARRAAQVLASTVASLPDPDIPVTALDSRQLLGTLLWSTGALTLNDVGLERHRRVKPVTWERLMSDPAAVKLVEQVEFIHPPAPAQLMESRLPEIGNGTVLLPATLHSAPLPPLPPQLRLAAHLVWDVTLTAERSPRWWYLGTLRLSAAAEVARAVLGDDAAAWETFAALAGEWDGTFGQLLLACQRFGGHP